MKTFKFTFGLNASKSNRKFSILLFPKQSYNKSTANAKISALVASAFVAGVSTVGNKLLIIVFLLEGKESFKIVE